MSRGKSKSPSEKKKAERVQFWSKAYIRHCTKETRFYGLHYGKEYAKRWRKVESKMSSNPPQQTFNPSDPASALDMLASIADSFQGDGKTHRAIGQAVQTLKNRLQEVDRTKEADAECLCALGQLNRIAKMLGFERIRLSEDSSCWYLVSDQYEVPLENRLLLIGAPFRPYDSADALPEAPDPDPPKQGTPENPEVGFVHEPVKV